MKEDIIRAKSGSSLVWTILEICEILGPFYQSFTTEEYRLIKGLNRKALSCFSLGNTRNKKYVYHNKKDRTVTTTWQGGIAYITKLKLRKLREICQKIPRQVIKENQQIFELYL